VFAEGSQGMEPGQAGRPPPHILERSARAVSQAELLQRHVAQTAHAVQSAAADTARLLERRADLLGQPGPIDYPTEIKKWRALADQAGKMAERWE
jgi:histidine ammonia-lyase